MTLKSPAIIYRNEEADGNIYMEIQNKLNIQINGGGKKAGEHFGMLYYYCKGTVLKRKWLLNRFMLNNEQNLTMYSHF